MAPFRLLSLPNEIIERIVEEVLAFNLAPQPATANGYIREASLYVTYREGDEPTLAIDGILYPSLSALRGLVPTIHRVNQQLRTISYHVVQRAPRRCENIGHRWGELDFLILGSWRSAVTWRSLPPRVLFPRGLDGTGYDSHSMPGMTRHGLMIRQPNAESGQRPYNTGFHIEDLTCTVRATGTAIDEIFNTPSQAFCDDVLESELRKAAFMPLLKVITRFLRYGPRLGSCFTHISQTTQDEKHPLSKVAREHARVLDNTQLRVIVEEIWHAEHAHHDTQIPLNTWSVGNFILDFCHYEDGEFPPMDCPHDRVCEWKQREREDRAPLWSFEREASLPQIATDAEFLLAFYMVKLGERLEPTYPLSIVIEMYRTIGYFILNLNGNEYCRKDMTEILCATRNHFQGDRSYSSYIRPWLKTHVRGRSQMGFVMPNDLISDLDASTSSGP